MFWLSKQLRVIGLGLATATGLAGPLVAQTVPGQTAPDSAGPQTNLPDDPLALLRAVLPGNGRNGEAQLRPAIGEGAADGAPAAQTAIDPAGLPADGQTGGRAGTYRAPGFESRLETVADRRRAELDPIGFKAGTYTFFPEVQISARRTDNVFSTATAEKSDTILSLRPSFLVRSDWRRHELAIAGEGEWGIFNRYKSENILRGSLTGEGRIDITPFASAGLRLSMAADQEGRGSPDAVSGATKPVRLRTYDAVANLSRRFNRLVAALRGGMSRTDYDDAVLLTGEIDNNDDRDVDTSSVGLRLTYEVSPAAGIYGDLEGDRQDYRQQVDDEGLRRSSDGWRAAIGTNIEVGRLARLDLELGYVFRKYDDAQLEAIGAFTADGRLTWSVTPLTTLRLGATSEVAETTVALASARQTQRVSFGIDHELLRQLTLGADIVYEKERLLGGDNAEKIDRLSASVGSEYRLSREASLVARLTRQIESPQDNSGDITETIASVGVTLRR